jgi:hypothetical protein
VNVIITNNPRAAEIHGSTKASPALTIVAGRAAKAMGSAAIRHIRLAAILGVLFLGSNYIGPAPAFSADSHQVIPLTQSNIDADGNNLRFPNFLFYDKAFDETYLSAGGGSQIIIYSGDFFPLISFASGRGIDRPYGGFVDHNGFIYVCQGPSEEKPGRISVFNGAFIMVREIFLDKIPEVPNFVPRRLVVGRYDLLYVAGRQNTGVLVLENDGTFLRWIQPMDKVHGNVGRYRYTGKGRPVAAKGGGTENGKAATSSTASIPEEFRPKSEEEKVATGPYTGPVMIQSVNMDSAGNLYLLSSETSKIYVYNAEETFLFSFGSKGGTPRTLSQPRRIAIDEDRKMIYVVDFMRHSIVVYDQNDGRVLFEFGGRGDGPGWFNFPTDIVVNRNGHVVVSDLFNNRIQLLEVKYQREIPPDQQPDSTSPAAETSSDLPKQSVPEVDSPGKSAGGSETVSATVEKQADGVIEEEIIEEFELPGKQETAEDPAAAEAIEVFIRSWIEAWERKDVKGYLSHYSKDFNPAGGISMAAWEKQRYIRIGSANFIEIDVRDMKIKKESDARVQVTFVQDYKSDTYDDLVVKMIGLMWENDGWAIATEEEW